MEDILEKMDPDRRLRLMNSAMKEFGDKQYEDASTNVIVRDAGISKGLLFHYFPSKKALFDALCLHVLRVMGTAIETGVDWENGDLISRIFGITRIKLKFLEKHPYMLAFTMTMYSGKSISEIREEVDAEFPDLYTRIYTRNIDYSLFREGLDPVKSLKAIQLFINGYTDEVLTSIKRADGAVDLPALMDSLGSYLEIYRMAFYRV